MHGAKAVDLSQDVRARGAREIVDSALIERPDNTSATDFQIQTTAMPISRRHRNVALSIVVLLCVAITIVAPFANILLIRVDAFIPVLQTVMCVVDLITAAILFSLYSIRPKFALLAIASGYVFSGLFAFLQTLAFPGAYSATGLIGDGVNTASWLFVLWHCSFYLAIVVYALTKDRNEAATPSVGTSAVAIGTSIAFVCGTVLGLTWIAAAGAMYLPALNVGITTQTSLSSALNAFLWLANASALSLLYVRRRTVLDVWLMVILLAWWPHFVLSFFFPVVRFTLGWYVARVFALLSSSTLLILLLTESMALYARLASSIGLLHRERADRLTSVEAATSAMAHEIRQPLSGIAGMATACRNWLKATPANIERASECVSAIIDATHRAEKTVSGIGGLFRRVPSERTMLQLNDVCREVMRLVQHDILISGISVRVRCQDDLPLINADNVQLQQVILNLVRNAIDALSSRPMGERRLRLWTSFDRNSAAISVCVRDFGLGISDSDREHIFEPFYTTKTNGMGLGLAISRKIIEEHEGILRLAETHSHGSMFEIVLPVSDSLRGSHQH